jgi:hypothetical protein
MNPQTPNPDNNEVHASQSAPAPGARCHRRTRHGHQCRLRPLSPGGLCFRHASLQSQVKQPVDVDLSGDFAAQLAELKSADQINDFLGKLLILVVQNRISVRRAAVLAYITNQLLRTVSIMNKGNNDVPQIIFDMPGPDRDRVTPDNAPQPEPTPTDVRT